jgi:DNA repair protein RadC
MRQKSFTRGIQRSCSHASIDPVRSELVPALGSAMLKVAKPPGISVHDHIIVGKEGHASFKGLR